MEWRKCINPAGTQDPKVDLTRGISSSKYNTHPSEMMVNNPAVLHSHPRVLHMQKTPAEMKVTKNFPTVEQQVTGQMFSV